MLDLEEYKGKLYTKEEIMLLKCFEEREERQKKQLELKRRQERALAQPIAMPNDPGRHLEVKPTKPIENIQDKKNTIEVDDVAAPVSSLKRKNDMTSNTEEVNTNNGAQPQEASSDMAENTASVAPETPQTTVPQATAPLTIKKKFRLQGAGDVDDERSKELEAEMMRPQYLDPKKYPEEGLLLSEDWNPLDEHSKGGKNKEFMLKNFGFLSNQTLAFKITVPAGSRRWAINIAPPETSDLSPWSDILLHFNPRYGGSKHKERLVITNKADDLWGIEEGKLIKDLSLPPVDTFLLLIQIRRDAFVMSINGRFIAAFPHRKDISNYRFLRLQLPIANDYNDPECVIFHKIWWGRRNPDTDIDFRGLTATEITSASQHLEESKRNLYVGNLPPTDDESRPALEEFLWELFTPYEAETIVLREGKTHAFVKLASAKLAGDAIEALNGYTIENVDDPTDDYKIIVSHSRY